MAEMLANEKARKRVLETIGEAAREARGALSVAEVAGATGMSRAQIGEIEAGKRNALALNLLALRAATGLDLNALADELADELRRD